MVFCKSSYFSNTYLKICQILNCLHKLAIIYKNIQNLLRHILYVILDLFFNYSVNYESK